jgi:radial spoke head protein 4A
MFEWGGVGLGKEEMYKIMLSLKRLVESNPIKTIRFFGKIFGRRSDYIIAESEMKEGAKQEAEEEQEAKSLQGNELT